MRATATQARRPRLVAVVLAAAVGTLAGAVVLERFYPLDHGPAPDARHGLRAARVEFDRFSARRERSEDGERLSVSLRLRAGTEPELPCFAFVVARNDRATPRIWAIWPPQPAGPVITAGGNFHGATPTAGHPLTLTETWQRLTATVPHPATGAFDTVVVYVVGIDGKILLSRPFRV